MFGVVGGDVFGGERERERGLLGAIAESEKYSGRKIHRK